MAQQPTITSVESPAAVQAGPQAFHALLAFVLAVRYRKNLVLAVMLAGGLLGGLYYATAPRYYSAQSQVQISQASDMSQRSSMADDESIRRNTMPTFESVFRSARVIQGALERLEPGDRIDLEGIAETRWVEAIQKKLSAKTVRGTSIIEVTYVSRDPKVAVTVVKAVVDSFLAFVDETHKGTTRENLNLLLAEQQTTAKKLDTARVSLLEARRGCDMAFRSEAKTLPFWEERVVFFNNALIGVQRERTDLQAAMGNIQDAMSHGRDLGEEILTFGDSLGRDVLANILGFSAADANVQSNLEQNLIKDSADLRMLQQHLGPAHPDIVVLQERIRLGQETLRQSHDRVRRRATELGTSQLGPWLVQVLRQKFEQLQRRENLLQQKFDEARSQAKSLGGQLAQVDVLQREEEQLNKWNERLQDRIAELSVRQKGQDIRTAVIEQPTVPTRPTSPRLGYVMIVTLLAGFGAALAVVHTLDLLDDRFGSLEELQARLRLPVLTMVQELGAHEGTGVHSLSMCAKPTAVENEAFRTLRTALSLINEGARQIVITSSEPGDGKTTVLANLAVGYAQSNKRTLVIDADMRRPGMTRLMEMRGPRGLSEVICGQGEVGQLAQENILASGAQGLDIMPCGPRSSNPAELLANPRFSQLLAWAAGAYDQVFVDAPPLLAASDAAAIGRLVDGVVVVARPAKNRRRLLTRVIDTLHTLRLPVLGIVVNRIGSDDERRYYGYREGGYGYGYGYGYDYGDHEATSSDDAPEPAEETEAIHIRSARVEDDLPATERIVPRRKLAARSGVFDGGKAA